MSVTLLRNLGFSYQKARFVSDHLDEVKRQEWRSVKLAGALCRRRGAGSVAAVWR